MGIENRITPRDIAFLSPNQVFVFGSNLAGIHGKGAAKTAVGWGAKFGQANGLQGKTYAIPTKDAEIRRTLSPQEIRPYVNEFIDFAVANPDLEFLVTEVGCGLAGLRPAQVAPLFVSAAQVENIALPSSFWLNLVPGT